jgi:hypothetical protein
MILQTYHTDAIVALLSSIKNLFQLRPQLKVVIATVVRNAAVFEFLNDQCCEYPNVIWNDY